MVGYIYKITNKVNNKCYIGKTLKANPIERWKEHIRDSRKVKNQHRHLYRAMNKYGVDNFDFTIVEEVISDDISERERFYIELYDSYKSGYNSTLGGDGKTYIEYSDQQIIDAYKAIGTITHTAKNLSVSYDIVESALRKNGIEALSRIEGAKLVQSKKVSQYDLEGNLIAVHDSIREATRTLGVPVKNASSIARVCNGERKVACGYRWEYYMAS